MSRATTISLAILVAVGCLGCSVVQRKPSLYGQAVPPASDKTAQRIAIPDSEVRIRAPVTAWRNMQRQNVVIQKLDYSCGSAALATLLRYYFQDDVAEQDVLKAIFVRLANSPNPREEIEDRVKRGFSMLDLLLAAKDLGYLGAVVRIPLEKLAQSKAPVIVRIEKFGYKHFVVFRGVAGDRVFLADPIRGNVRLSAGEFCKQWSGESLFLGKAGFGLPDDHPLAVKIDGPPCPELEVARQAMFRASTP